MFKYMAEICTSTSLPAEGGCKCKFKGKHEKKSNAKFKPVRLGGSKKKTIQGSKFKAQGLRIALQ
jgi:hypothetical protein